MCLFIVFVEALYFLLIVKFPVVCQFPFWAHWAVLPTTLLIFCIVIETSCIKVQLWFCLIFVACISDLLWWIDWYFKLSSYHCYFLMLMLIDPNLCSSFFLAFYNIVWIWIQKVKINYDFKISTFYIDDSLFMI